MSRELAVAAGLVVLAFLLMAFARNLYPTIPSVPESITLEEQITTTTTYQNATTTTTTPSTSTTTTQLPETTTTTETEHEETTTTTTEPEETTTTAAPVAGQELGISFYNSILAMINLEEMEEEFEGLVSEAYVAGVQDTCNSCVGVLVVNMDGKEVAVVLVNTWLLEDDESRMIEAVDLAKLLLGSHAEFRVIKLNYEINGLETYAAIEIGWDDYYAELISNHLSGD